MPIPDSPTPFNEDPPIREAPPSRDEIIFTEALRRRVAATAAGCLSAFVREAPYEELEVLLELFGCLGSPQAMLLENPEGQFGMPGLTLEEANALVRFRMQRGECYVPPGCAGPESVPAPGDPPSCDEVIATQAFRQRLAAIAERCLPTIIREADNGVLEDLMSVFRLFGNSEAMQLDAPEDYAKAPRLTLEDASALVRPGIKCRECCGPFGDREPETSPPVPAAAEPIAPAAPVRPIAETAEPAGASTPAAAQAPVKPPGATFPAKAELPGPQTLCLVFKNGRMWYMDPKIKKIVSEAPLFHK